MPITVSGTTITFNDATTQTTAGITSAVTSLNGQTGAITNTSLGAIGSYLMLVNNTTSNFVTGNTTAGSNLRYPSQVTERLSAANFRTVGSGGSIPRSDTNAMGSQFSQVVSGNVGNGGNAQGTTAVSGTWQCVSPAGGRTNNGYCGCNNSTEQGLCYSMWVRIS